MSFSREAHQEWNSWVQVVQENLQENLRLTPCASRLMIRNMLHAICSLLFLVASRPKADPLTSRPAGPVLDLVVFCRHALCALRCRE